MATVESDFRHCDFVSYRKGFDDIVVGGAVDFDLLAESAKEATDSGVVEPLGAAALLAEAEIELPTDSDN